MLRQKAIGEFFSEEMLEIHTTDKGAVNNLAAWAQSGGHQLVKHEEENNLLKFWIKKDNFLYVNIPLCVYWNKIKEALYMGETKKTTIVLLSGDYDKAMAAYIIANGAAAYDHEVTIFHTFWGLNALRKEEKVPVQKGFMEKMFAKMMPRGANKMGLSKMNFAGFGPKMIKRIMKKHNAMPLPELIEMAKEQDVKLIACTMTMDLLGLQKEELLEDIEYAGVAAYLGEAEDGNVNLFI